MKHGIRTNGNSLCHYFTQIIFLFYFFSPSVIYAQAFEKQNIILAFMLWDWRVSLACRSILEHPEAYASTPKQDKRKHLVLHHARSNHLTYQLEHRGLCTTEAVSYSFFFGFFALYTNFPFPFSCSLLLLFFFTFQFVQRFKMTEKSVQGQIH